MNLRLNVLNPLDMTVFAFVTLIPIRDSSEMISTPPACNLSSNLSIARGLLSLRFRYPDFYEFVDMV